MESRSKVSGLAAIAGLACAMSVSAQSMFETPVRYQGRAIAATAVDGKPIVDRGSTDGEETLYKNDTGIFFSTTSVPNTLGGDIISFNPGPGAGTSGTITRIAPGFVVTATAPNPMNFDILVSFWDDINLTAPAGMPVHENQMGATVRLAYRNVAPGFYYNTVPPVVLTTPIAYDDDEFFYRVEFVEPDTTTRVPDLTATFGFANSDATMGPSPGSSPTPPPNIDHTYYRDANGNGIVEVADLRGFAAPNRANMGLMIAGIEGGGGCPPCVCNIDTSTGQNVCDIFDFLTFGNLFSAADPCACDVDTSTGPGVCDIFDFLTFGNLFSAGC